MTHYQEILAATESEQVHLDAFALNRAARLAQATGAHLHLFHASTPISSIGSVYALPSLIDMEISQATSAKQDIEDMGRVFGINETDCTVEIGFPRNTIRGEAKRVAAQLIVLDNRQTHRHGLMTETTACAILPNAQCDILGVNSTVEQTEKQDNIYKHVLLAIDVTNPKQEIVQLIEHALEICDAKKTKLSLLSVNNEQQSQQATLAKEFANYNTAEITEAEAILADIGRQVGILAIDQQVLVGAPQQRIIEQAEAIGADLIVMGNHGHRGLRLWFSSTVYTVFHHARCDVLAVKIKKLKKRFRKESSLWRTTNAPPATELRA